MKLRRNMLVVLLACVISASLVVGAQGKDTLRVWGQLDEPKQMEVMEEIIRKLEQMRPDVKVEYTPLAREDMDKVLPLSLGAGVGPDIADYDTGDAFLGSLVGLKNEQKYLASFSFIDQTSGSTLLRSSFASSRLFTVGSPVSRNFRPEASEKAF